MPNVNTLQIIRPWGYAAEKEFLKEFFRFIGCLVYDTTVSQFSGWTEFLQADPADNDVDIVLNCPVEDHYVVSAGHRRIYVDFAFPVEDQINYNYHVGDTQGKQVTYNYQVGTTQEELHQNQYVATSKKELRAGVLEKLIDLIWEDKPEGKVCIQEVRKLYLQKNLYNILQCKRGFRILRMGEAIDANINISHIPPQAYALEMLRNLWYVYAVLRRQQRLEDTTNTFYNVKESTRSRCIYSVYACVNAGRCIRQIFNLLSYTPSESLDCDFVETNLSPEECKFEVCTVETLIGYLRFILEEDPSHLTAYLMAATVCSTSEETKASAREYYDYILDKAAGNEKYYAFIQYQLGSYYEKIGGNKEAALSCYQYAQKADPSRCYQAQYKLACHAARIGRFDEAERGFQRVVEIIFCGNSPEPNADGIYSNWEQLSLKELQYIFKSYIWQAKIAYNHYGSQAFTAAYIGKACLAATMYQYTLLVKRSLDYSDVEEEGKAQQLFASWQALPVDKDVLQARQSTFYTDRAEWKRIKNYHETGFPLWVLWKVLGAWVDGVINDPYLSHIVHQKLNEFSQRSAIFSE